MNALLAQLLKDRISQFAYVDRLAGLVRAVEREQAGGSITIPVALGVDDPLACDDSSLRDLVPDERYACMVYFEDKGCRTVQTRTRGTSFECRMRLVCWVNTARFNGDAYAGDRIMQQFVGAIPSGVYNDGPFIGVRHSIEAVPERGASLFSPYTYPSEARQYLLYPFDAFAIDIITALRVKPGCEDQVNTTNAECWTPPANRRRRFPSEFTCEELNAPLTGLTDEQKEDCLDCSDGGGPCDDVSVQLTDSDGNHIGAPDTYAAGTITTKVAPDGSVQRQDANGADIGGPIAVRSNQTGLAVTCPDATVQLLDSAGSAIAPPASYRSGSSNDLTAPDGTVRDTADTTTVMGVRSGEAKPLPQSRIKYRDAANAPQVTAPSNTEIASGTLRPATEIPRRPINHVGGVPTGVFADAGALIADTLPEVPLRSYALREWTTSGTWSKPAGLRGLFLSLWAGGGGGGAGSVTATNGTGGGGGAGGQWVHLYIPASSLAATENYVIGSGGQGGVTTAGLPGGDTTFGTSVLARAKGGGGGSLGSTGSGTVSGGAPGSVDSALPARGPHALIAGAGGVGVRSLNQPTAGPGGNGLDGAQSGAGGGGGGGLLSNAPCAGYIGGGCYYLGLLTNGGAAGSSGGGAGGNGLSDVNLDALLGILAPTIGPGTGGGGGGGINGANGGNGGNGGRAAGGGGGGACVSGTRGAGGNGGPGFIIAVEIF